MSPNFEWNPEPSAHLDATTQRFHESKRDLDQLEYLLKGLKRMMKCGKVQPACASDPAECAMGPTSKSPIRPTEKPSMWKLSPKWCPLYRAAALQYRKRRSCSGASKNSPKSCGSGPNWPNFNLTIDRKNRGYSDIPALPIATGRLNHPKQLILLWLAVVLSSRTHFQAAMNADEHSITSSFLIGVHLRSSAAEPSSATASAANSSAAR